MRYGDTMNVLILDDGRMGHFNQSLALAVLSGARYEVCKVRYRSRTAKWLSYLFDWAHIRSFLLFDAQLPSGTFDIVVGTGSTCAYPLKVVSHRLQAKSVSMMYPKGYRLDYDTIFAQAHDAPPRLPNLIEIPVNFNHAQPAGLFIPKGKAVGIVIGGANRVFRFDTTLLKRQLDAIFEQFRGSEFALTTSPRTSQEVVALLKTYPFDYAVYYSENPINPIPDFLFGCKRVFITQDSTSMISEAVCNGTACIDILPLAGTPGSKFERLVQRLCRDGHAHIFDGTNHCADRKIDFTPYLVRAGLLQEPNRV